MTENARMGGLLLQFLPFFALVALGWGATRRGWLPLAGIPALNVFVLYFGLPAMLFRLGASGALWQPGLGGLALVYGVVGLTITAGAMAWAWRGGLSRLDGGLAALATTFPNTGFLGLPLLTGLLGPLEVLSLDVGKEDICTPSSSESISLPSSSLCALLTSTLMFSCVSFFMPLVSIMKIMHSTAPNTLMPTVSRHGSRYGNSTQIEPGPDGKSDGYFSAGLHSRPPINGARIAPAVQERLNR